VWREQIAHDDLSSRSDDLGLTFTGAATVVLAKPGMYRLTGSPTAIFPSSTNNRIAMIPASRDRHEPTRLFSEST